ncbi:Long-chain-fatty-acid--CoA ligase [Streptomyces venezuelae ATCC 10712]|uniref:Long-chain-fatty-acid--CoA ligase n=1 Tax=Streptomyces venezuelae (strain ATCC 10712 / CBS 650.69 / DSM 40230 / JCM 4526 / NBRC 13096 / PD 04745) TaxID=953739 RepID=F2RIT3_STRVP|nr:acyl-CoA synthetase [Streptomyces venezuelae]QES02784.1 long-chain fatty acid--CoA ligase [Streptomyces venezuelae ATCC 10712]CCA60059.1 Long-chain-fatty-acid--CoA ligase [Streptomyces venezuelae ATCC 10712]
MTVDEGRRRDTSPSGSGTGPDAVPGSLVAAWKARVARNPGGTALRFFDGALSAREVDAASDALAAAFEARGTGRGDRVGVYLQNVPQYALVLLALWKLGATALGLNPMYRRRELRRIVEDSGAVGVVCADEDVHETLGTLAGSTVRWLISTSALDYQSRNDPRVFATTERLAPAPDGDLVALIGAYRGRRPAPVELTPEDVAFLTYTSGTTGPPKGAMNTHANVLSVVATCASWVRVDDGDVVFAMAPLFHITGAVVNATLSLLTDTTLVLAGRFHPEVALEAFAEHQVTYTIGSITAYNAIYELPQAGPEHFATAKALYSGGAPIPPATVERFRERFGVYLHNGYGMTETTSAVIAVPPGERAPVHLPSGTLSIGKPLPHLTARVVDLHGDPMPCGQQGELELSGPQVVPGYWGKPEATRRTMPEGRLRTGDVAVIDEQGWVYLVDRLKDQINVSGYKVWPREVEDALYEHPSVLEAAVVGQPDEYRGETVVAYVSLKAGLTASAEELIAFSRERLAAYKCPRTIHFLADLPKTQSGKIRRAELRGLDGTEPDSPSKD